MFGIKDPNEQTNGIGKLIKFHYHLRFVGLNEINHLEMFDENKIKEKM